MTQSVTWPITLPIFRIADQTQIDALEHALLLQQPANTNNGAIGWTTPLPTMRWISLRGQTATRDATITLDDLGQEDTATVTITVTGANDAPTLDDVTTAPLTNRRHRQFPHHYRHAVGHDVDQATRFYMRARCGPRGKYGGGRPMAR